jgi:hypothetical protein
VVGNLTVVSVAPRFCSQVLRLSAVPAAQAPLLRGCWHLLAVLLLLRHLLLLAALQLLLLLRTTMTIVPCTMRRRGAAARWRNVH